MPAGNLSVKRREAAVDAAFEDLRLKLRYLQKRAQYYKREHGNSSLPKHVSEVATLVRRLRNQVAVLRKAYWRKKGTTMKLNGKQQQRLEDAKVMRRLMNVRGLGAERNVGRGTLKRFAEDGFEKLLRAERDT